MDSTGNLWFVWGWSGDRLVLRSQETAQLIKPLNSASVRLALIQL
jgi:hypothetical protein